MTSRLVSFSLRSLRHAGLRSLTQVLAIAAALALLGSIFLFVSGNLGAMTAAAANRVPLDWQAAVPDASSATSLATRLTGIAGLTAAAPAATAGLASASHAVGGSIATSGGGSVLAVPSDYLSRFHPFHLLAGRLQSTGVVLSQPLASTLQAQVGDTVSLQLAPNSPAQRVTVTGIAVIDVSELIFQPLGISAGGAPAAPPTQVVVVSIELFQQQLAGGAGVQWEVHGQVERSLLQGGPAEAQQRLATFRHVVERTFTGELTIADNLDAALGVAAEQSLYGQAIFIFLALPGVIIALWLAYYAAASGAADERRDIALLRTRGASRADIVGGAVTQGIVIGALASLLGLLAAVTALQLSGVTSMNGGQLARAGTVVLFVGLIAGVAARLGIALRVYRAVIAVARAREPRATRPLWSRLYLDILALIGSAVVFAIDRATGLSAVVNPDTNPTLALSLYSFLAPTLLWVGATLLLVRVGSSALRWAGGRLPAAGSGGGLLPFLVQSSGRRSGAISRAVILVGLLLSFGVSLGLFSATYDRQSLADARLTVGADVVASAPPNGQLSTTTLERISVASGVTGTSPMRHTYAYLGPDLQDMYAVDATTVSTATQLRDSYFSGSSAAASLEGLRQRKDGVLVSAEAIKDYGLSVGDLIRLRLQDASNGQYQVSDFHVVGVVKEFPTAPKDSFLVANFSYVLAITHAVGANVALISASGDPHAVATRVQSAIASSGATTTDITTQAARTSSSLTAVSLAGISRIEEGFAVALALASVVLFAGLSGIERRRELATMAAMGARLRVVASFVWTETTVVIAMAALLAALLGTALAVMLVAILTHIFDPPPDVLTVPWRFLGLLAVAVVAGTLASAAISLVSLRRADLSSTLREG